MLQQNRKHSKIDKLPPNQKDTVEQMLMSGATYAEVVDYLAENGTEISQASVCRYAKGLAKNVAMVNIAGENFRRLMAEIEKYPKLDTTEVIMQLTSQMMLHAISELEPDDLKGIDPIKLFRQANGLVRAGAYKNRIDVQNQDDYEAGLEAAKEMFFTAMRKDRPELYKEVAAFLNEQKSANNEE